MDRVRVMVFKGNGTLRWAAESIPASYRLSVPLERGSEALDLQLLVDTPDLTTLHAASSMRELFLYMADERRLSVVFNRSGKLTEFGPVQIGDDEGRWFKHSLPWTHPNPYAGNDLVLKMGELQVHEAHSDEKEAYSSYHDLWLAQHADSIEVAEIWKTGRRREVLK